ncbi:MAG TPA: methyltransferase domain-containing protein [Bryobacteraceae bacterium]|nr:methyltransferase domain-containing protein [Bryobacteraceae bacterium]
MARRFLIATPALFACLWACLAQDAYQREAARLSTFLNWQPGSVVAEIGAGQGQFTLIAAERVGAAGRVYTTELDAGKFAHLQEIAADHKNITALRAAEAQTNLPPDCCDSIWMRLVYHHFVKPAEMDASLFRSLKPGGRLAVIDEEPKPGSSRVAGVPENRGGHGVPQKILIAELTAAGFEVAKISDDWSDGDYCVVFRKPAP